MNIKSDAHGIIPALVTPRSEDGGVAADLIKPIVDFVFSKGVDGLFICGSTGQGLSLTVEERKAVCQAAVAAAADRGPVIVHVSSISTREVCELSAHAAQAGAQALSSLPPFYYRLGLPEIKDHYRRIADVSGLPVFIYNIPRATNVPITPDMAAALAEDGLVCGIKIPNADMYTLSRLAGINPGKFTVFTGETHYLAGLANEITVGTIGSMSNWIPELFVGLKGNFQAGNLRRSAELQQLACRLFSTYGQEELASTKALLELRNLPCGDPWLPVRPLTAEKKRDLHQAIDSFALDFDELARIG